MHMHNFSLFAFESLISANPLPCAGSKVNGGPTMTSLRHTTTTLQAPSGGNGVARGCRLIKAVPPPPPPPSVSFHGGGNPPTSSYCRYHCFSAADSSTAAAAAQNRGGTGRNSSGGRKSATVDRRSSLAAGSCVSSGTHDAVVGAAAEVSSVATLQRHKAHTSVVWTADDRAREDRSLITRWIRRRRSRVMYCNDRISMASSRSR